MARNKTTTDLSTSILTGSDEMFDFFCEPCSPDKHVEAVGYCKDCSEYLCLSCINYHGRLAALKHHTVLDKSSMPKTKIQPKIRLTDILTEKCLKHTDEVLKYFCKTHKQICCSVCITLDHISCSDKNYIPDVSSGIAKGQEYKNIRTDLDRLLKQIAQIQEKNNDATKTNEKYRSKALVDIAVFRKQINDTLDEIENDIKKKVAELHQENIDVMIKESEKCQSLLAEVSSMATDLDKNANAGNNSQLFVQMKLSAFRLAEVKTQLKEIGDLEVKRYEFHPDEKIQQMVSTLSAIWSLSIKQGEESTKARYVRELNVKSENDTKECDINGIAVLAKDRMAMTDFNNKAIKLIDMKINKLISRLPVSSEPYGITVTKPNQVAVSLALEEKIDLITVSDVLSTGMTVKTNSTVITGLCYNGLNFIGACLIKGTIKIIDVSGKTLSTFGKDGNGGKLFDTPWCIYLSRDGKGVFVTDYRNNTVTCLSLSGHVIWVYRHDKLVYPKGVAVGKNGAVYVCSRDTQTVHQLTPTGDLTRIILGNDKGLVHFPGAIGYGVEDERLYISSNSSAPVDGNFIRIYQLE